MIGGRSVVVLRRGGVVVLVGIPHILSGRRVAD